jgi:hypothetical protein
MLGPVCWVNPSETRVARLSLFPGSSVMNNSWCGNAGVSFPFNAEQLSLSGASLPSYLLKRCGDRLRRVAALVVRIFSKPSKNKFLELRE